MQTCKVNTSPAAFYQYSEVTNWTYNPTTGKVIQYAKCNVGKKYSIPSLLREKGAGYCTLALATEKVADNISGVWSVDSSGTYNTPENM